MEMMLFALIVAALCSITEALNVSAVVQHTALLPCRTDVEGSQVMWFDEHNKLLTSNANTATDDTRISVDHPYSKEWNLQITSVRKTDQGNYSCYISVSGQSTRKYVFLEIHYSPQIVSSSEDLSVVTGTDVSIQCEATGSPQPGISWYKHTFEKERVLVASNQNIYTIEGVTKADASVYECEADNGVPPVTYEKIEVDIQFVPLMTLPYQQFSQKEGKDTLLDCLVTANPISSHYWMKDGLVIEDSQKYTLYKWEVSQYTQRLGLFITVLEESDFGEYVCVSGNEYGRINETMQLNQIVTSTAKVTMKPEDSVSLMHNDVLINCTVEGMTHRDNLIWWRNTLSNGYQKLYESNPPTEVAPSQKTTPNINNAQDVKYNIDNNNNNGQSETIVKTQTETVGLDDQNEGGKKEEDMMSSGKMEVVGHFNLLIHDVSMQDGGTYGCELVGKPSYEAQVTIVDNLTCLNNESHITQGDFMNISCTLHFSGNHRNWDVTWQHGERKLSSINHDSQDTLLRLVSFRSWATDSGMYTCNVQSLGSSFHSSCKTEMFVQEPPVITFPPPVIPSGAPIQGQDQFSTSMTGIVLGVALVAITLLMFIILLATISYYRKELAKYKNIPPRRTRTNRPAYGEMTTKFENGAGVEMQALKAPSRQESNTSVPEAEA